MTGYSTATDLADWLVRSLKMPFRDAHHVTGRMVALAEKKDLRLDQLSLADLQAIEPRITKAVFSVLDGRSFGCIARKFWRHSACTMCSGSCGAVARRTR